MGQIFKSCGNNVTAECGLFQSGDGKDESSALEMTLMFLGWWSIAHQTWGAKMILLEWMIDSQNVSFQPF